jgi:hypothetical protein
MTSANTITTLTGVTDLRIGFELGTGKPCVIIDTVGGTKYITLDVADPFSANRIASKIRGYNVGFDDAHDEATYPALTTPEVLNG